MNRLMIYMHQKPTTCAVVFLVAVLVPVWLLTGEWGML